MANANAPAGLRPARQGDGGTWTGETRLYYLNTSEANDIYVGDPMIILGDADANGVPTIGLATAGATNRITGAVVGFVPSPGIIANGYRKASTAEYVMVAVGTDLVYEVQATTLAAADLEANSVLASGTGSRITGSGWYMDTATKGTSATYQLRIVGVAQREDNALGAYCKALVRINLPTEAGIASGVGV